MRDGRVVLGAFFSVLCTGLLLADTPAELFIFAAPLRVFSFPGVASHTFRRSQIIQIQNVLSHRITSESEINACNSLRAQR
jgi:hypothetical protein